MIYNDLVGVPFREGGRDLRALDCWGLVLECYRRQGIVLNDPFAEETQASVKTQQHLTADQWIAARFDHWEKTDEPSCGRVVAFRDVDGFAVHVGVLISADKFLHAMKATGVVISSLNRDPWCHRMIGVYAYAH